MLKDLLCELPLVVEHSRSELDRSGIYRIRNLLTGMFYIGSTRRSFRHRYNAHFGDLRAGRHNNARLQNAFRKYGENNFVFEVLHFLDRQHLKVEQQYLARYYEHPLCYNLAKHVDKPQKDRPGYFQGRKHSAETKAKIGAKSKGRRWPLESRARAAVNRRGHSVSAETRAKLRAAALGNTHVRDWLRLKVSSQFDASR